MNLSLFDIRNRFFSTTKAHRTASLADSRWVILVAFLIALGAFASAPVLAIQWANRPFLGLVVEQTLVISDSHGDYWTGRLFRIVHPNRITYINGRKIDSLAEYDEFINELSKGEWLQIKTELPDGRKRAFPPLEVGNFPSQDMLRLFWLPYGVGLAYLVMAAWVYRLRGNSVSARAFAYFCICSAIAIGLLFDLITTHVGSALWTIAIAQVGSAMISLALLFPEEWAPVKRRKWLRFLPFAFSAGLAVWSLVVLRDMERPWAYIKSWGYSYNYAFLGILFLLGMMVYRLRTTQSIVKRQQARLILLGSILAYSPIAVFFGASLFGLNVHWNTTIFLPSLLIFPLSIAFAILRYKLWDVDVIINRTLIYGALTVILAVLYAASVIVFEQVFNSLLGQTSRLAAAASTLTVAALFNPVRRYVQDFIDSRFYRRKYDAVKTLAAFGATLRDEVNLNKLVERLENVIHQTIQPAHVSTWLATSSGFRPYLPSENPFPNQPPGMTLVIQEIPLSDPIAGYLKTTPEAISLSQLDLASPALQAMMAAGISIAMPLVSQGELMGWINVGHRLSEQDYSTDDRALLTNLSVQASPAVRVAQLVSQQQAEAQKRDRLDYELRLARTIQYSLLPEELPTLPSWQMATYYQPASAVGGDFYDFLHLEDGRLGVVIGDVADKGIPAALVMAVTRSLIRAVGQEETSPGQVLARVNELLIPDIPSGMFVTCLYAVLDPITGLLRYANAGHNPPYHRHNGSAEALRARGMPLGLMPDMSYEEKETTIARNECVILYSDGLVEAHDKQQEMYGYQRLQAWVKNNNGCGSELIENLLSELDNFTGPGWEQEDDITLVALKRTEQWN